MKVKYVAGGKGQSATGIKFGDVRFALNETKDLPADVVDKLRLRERGGFEVVSAVGGKKKNESDEV